MANTLASPDGPSPDTTGVASTGQQSRLATVKEGGNYVLGWVLVVSALVDGAIDPFSGLTAPTLLASGLALLGADKVSDLFK